MSPKPRLTYNTSTHHDDDHQDDDSHGTHSYYDGEYELNDFYHEVHEFDTCDEIWNQDDYEERLETEAELMVALEAIREALVQLDSDIHELETCIEGNSGHIGVNFDQITQNDFRIETNDIEIGRQQHRLEALQWRCRNCQDKLDDDRSLLVLYC